MNTKPLVDIEIDRNGNITFVVAGMVRHGSLGALADALYDRPVKNAPKPAVLEAIVTDTIGGSRRIRYEDFA